MHPDSRAEDEYRIELMERWLEPFGIDIGDLSTPILGAFIFATQDVIDKTHEAMVEPEGRLIDDGTSCFEVPGTRDWTKL